MDSIIVFSRFFYRISETFIYKQVTYLKQYYTVYLVADDFSEGSNFDFTNVHKIKLNRLEQKITRKLHKLFKKSDDRVSFYNPYQVKKLIKEKNIKLIHAHFGTSGIRIMPLAKQMGVPLIVSFHGFDASRILRKSVFLDRMPDLFNYAGTIIIVSRHMTANLNLEKWMDKVLLLPYSISTDEYAPAAPTQQRDHFTILHAGRLVPKKGVPDLITAFGNIYKNHNHVRLRILGEGPELPQCQAKVAELGLTDVVVFLGAQPRDVVKKELYQTDIVVANSRTADDGDMEGTPVVVLEAMSTGKAVVSTYHAGIPDVIQDGVNGRLVPERDTASLEKTIIELLHDRAQIDRLGQAARKTIVENYSNEKLLPPLRTAVAHAIQQAAEARRR